MSSETRRTFAPGEEDGLRKVVALKYPQHRTELDMALNTGMRRSEQYSRILL